jgi:hypothetical protein
MSAMDMPFLGRLKLAYATEAEKFMVFNPLNSLTRTQSTELFVSLFQNSLN